MPSQDGVLGAVDPSCRVVQPADGPRAERVPRALGQPHRLQPALPHHPRHGGADGRRGDAERGEQPHQGGHRRPPTAGAQVVAVEVEQG